MAVTVVRTYPSALGDPVMLDLHGLDQVLLERDPLEKDRPQQLVLGVVVFVEHAEHQVDIEYVTRGSGVASGARRS
jgi:hypothetical protein